MSKAQQMKARVEYDLRRAQAFDDTFKGGDSDEEGAVFIFDRMLHFGCVSTSCPGPP
jgi:hypothetical protein